MQGGKNMLFEKFRQGINLGGYLSQYEIVADASDPVQLKNHFETFITRQDLERIASWGFDHVRITMDGMLFFDRTKGALRQEPLFYLDRLLENCRQAKLNAILDLHNIWGHRYGEMTVPTALMVETEPRETFIAFWKQMAEHLKDFQGITLLFELFNEIADATGYCWNSLYKRTVQEIRKIDKNRWILVGSNAVNSIAYLDRLDLLDDPCVFYNFHYYEPVVFTHQKAHFSEEMRSYDHALSYPGDFTEYHEFLKQHPDWQKEHFLIGPEDTCNDEGLMDRYLSYAKDFVTYSGKELMCTEFGVIDSADETDAEKWIRDFVTKCNELHIGHSMWNYKELDFEIVNLKGEAVRPGLLEMLIKLNKA